MFDYQLYVSKCAKSFSEGEEYRKSFIIEVKEEVEETRKPTEDEIKKDLRRRIKSLGVNPNPKASLEELQAKLLELNS